jgi:peptide/nickel transport system substrate-binding protein
LRQFSSNFSLEGLVNLKEDGRPRPWLAEGWSLSSDGRSLAVRLRPNAKFHDGSLVTAPLIAKALTVTLPRMLVSVFEDVENIAATSDTEVRIQLKRPSPFVLEALEGVIQKPGAEGIGTGPFALSGPNELRSFESYYLGPPTIDRITQTAYPSVRTAWAELLRGKLDMLYEVNLDALDSLTASTDVSVFSYLRHYQYTITFGGRASSLEVAAIRRELNAAIDRDAVVRDGLNGHGIPSTGPVPPQNWALDKNAPRLAFDRSLASNLAGRRLQFTCLVPADSVYERVALVVKQQLAAAGVDMRVEEATQQQILEATKDNDFEAVLIDGLSGPSVYRSYRQFYSKFPFVPKPRSSSLIDAALDHVRHAASDDEYRAGVNEFQRAIVDDPPAIFLAWGERARAVSRRFDVPAPEEGRDVLATLGQWRPKADQRAANSN